MSKKMEIVCGQEQIDELLAELEAEKDEMVDNVITEINAATPIFAVSYTTTEGKEVHFANFYGTTIYEHLSQEEFEAKVQENDATIYEMLNELEQKINAGNFKKVNKDLLLKVGIAQFGGFMHKKMAIMEDTISCDSVEKAFDLFKREYTAINKTKKQLEKEQQERLENYKKSLDALTNILFD